MSELEGSTENTESTIESASEASTESKPEPGESNPPGWEAAKQQVDAAKASGQITDLNSDSDQGGAAGTGDSANTHAIGVADSDEKGIPLSGDVNTKRGGRTR
jgi:hypothetical protein